MVIFQERETARAPMVLHYFSWQTHGTIFSAPGLQLHAIMPYEMPHFRPPPLPEPAPVVHVVAQEDVQWNRPVVFKAPPLEVDPNLFLPAKLTDVFRELNPARR